jgi:DNA polymerase
MMRRWPCARLPLLWLQRELASLQPHIIVCLGAIAARNVLGAKFKLMQQRGSWQAPTARARSPRCIHRGCLRQRDSEARAQAYAGFVADLALLLGT